MIPNWLNKLLLTLFFILGFVVLPYTASLVISNCYNFYTCESMSVGIVKDVENDNYRKESKITFSFSLPNGTERESSQRVGISEPKYKVGDKVRVRYKSEYAALDDVELIYPDLMAIPMMVIIGIPIFLVMIVYIRFLGMRAYYYVKYYIKYYIKGDV